MPADQTRGLWSSWLRDYDAIADCVVAIFFLAKMVSKKVLFGHFKECTPMSLQKRTGRFSPLSVFQLYIITYKILFESVGTKMLTVDRMLRFSVSLSTQTRPQTRTRTRTRPQTRNLNLTRNQKKEEKKLLTRNLNRIEPEPESET